MQTLPKFKLFLLNLPENSGRSRQEPLPWAQDREKIRMEHRIINPSKYASIMKDIKYIIVHCSATRAGLNFQAADIDRWHKARGWAGIGYHYVVDLDGKIEPGRKETEVGAHAGALINPISLGVCYIGGLTQDTAEPADTRTPAQKAALEALLLDLLRRYPDAQVIGHKDISARACPCFNAAEEYKHLRERASAEPNQLTNHEEKTEEPAAEPAEEEALPLAEGLETMGEEEPGEAGPAKPHAVLPAAAASAPDGVDSAETALDAAEAAVDVASLFAKGKAKGILLLVGAAIGIVKGFVAKLRKPKPRP